MYLLKMARMNMSDESRKWSLLEEMRFYRRCSLYRRMEVWRLFGQERFIIANLIKRTSWYRAYMKRMVMARYRKRRPMTQPGIYGVLKRRGKLLEAADAPFFRDESTTEGRYSALAAAWRALLPSAFADRWRCYILASSKILLEDELSAFQDELILTRPVMRRFITQRRRREEVGMMPEY